jgi:hypothetical protein
MQTSNAITPSAPPPSPGATPLPAEQRHLSGIERLKENNRLAADAANRVNEDPTQPGQPNSYFWSKALRWFAPVSKTPERHLNAEGVRVSRNLSPENIPAAGFPATPSNAELELLEARSELNDLRVKAEKIRAAIQGYYDAPATLEAAKTKLRELESAELQANIAVELGDLSVEALDKLRDDVADQRVLVGKLTREAAVAKGVYDRRYSTELQPLYERITAIESKFKRLQADACTERLSESAAHYREICEMQYWATVHVFGLVRARKYLQSPGLMGFGSAGRETNLVLPTPPDLPYDFVTVPSIARDVEEEAKRILNELGQ